MQKDIEGTYTFLLLKKPVKRECLFSHVEESGSDGKKGGMGVNGERQTALLSTCMLPTTLECFIALEIIQ
jgi:hypothetical protein